MIDLSNNENSIIKHKIQIPKNIHKYPCDNEYLLKEKLAKIHSVKSSNVSLGNGSSELIYRSIIAFNQLAINQGKILNFIVFTPTFDLALSIAKALEIKTTFIPLNDDFSLPKISLNDDELSLIYITNPNNPSAKELSKDELEYIKNLDAYIILDEAYAEYNPKFLSLKKDKYKNIIFTRTFSKIYALAGLRLGYMLADDKLLEYIDKFILLDNINAFALYEGLRVLDDENIIDYTRAKIKENKELIINVFDELNISCFKSNVNFILHEIKDLKYNDFMYSQGIKVGREIKNFPLLNRISIGNYDETIAFINALRLAKANGFV